MELPGDLNRVLRDYEQGWRTGDALLLSSLFTEDGFVLERGQPPVRGRPDIARAYGNTRGALYLVALAYAAGDTVGYILGTFGGADTSSHAAKFLLALRRDSTGRWLIAADMANPDTP